MHVNNDSEKREVIRRAARELFFRFGFSKTAMADIARQSDLAKASLYYYYRSKEEIFDEIVIAEAQVFMDRVEVEILKDCPADERLAAFLEKIYQGKKFYADKMADCPEYLRKHSPHGHPIIDKMRQLFKAKLVILIQEGQRTGAFRSADPQHLAETLSFMMEFMSLDWMHFYPEPQRDRAVTTMIEIIVNGLKRRD